jgi:hypothetical protein
MHKAIFIIGLICFCHCNAFAQCKARPTISPKMVQEVNDVFQFTFLHYPPINRLDTLVCQLNYPIRVLDSSFFNWPKNNEKARSNIDVFNATKVIDAIGQQKAKEAFFILQLPYYYSEYSMLRNMHKADDLSPFNGMLSNLQYYNGGDVLNTYFLNNSVSKKLPKQKFEEAVVKKCKAIRNNYIKDLQYCVPLQGEDYQLAMMKKENPAACDSAVLKIIRKYINNNPTQKSYYSMDSIMIEVHQLEKVIDAQNDNCVAQVVADDGCSYTRLGVIYHTSFDFITQQKIYIMRVYTIKNNPRFGQEILGADWSVDFISRTRKQCNDEE